MPAGIVTLVRQDRPGRSRIRVGCGALESHKAVVILEAPDNPEAKAILVPITRAVMTSTSGGNDGPTVSWINLQPDRQQCIPTSY